MGGEDVGSDDELYLDPLRGSDGEDSSNDEPAPTKQHESSMEESIKQKRSIASDEKDIESASKKRKRNGGSALRKLGKEIRSAAKDVQAKLLAEFTGATFLPQNVGRSIQSEEDGIGEEGAAKRIQSMVSKKKLKKWKEVESPCVIIICLSARRAVQMLKELAPLNVRAAKLFAKHIMIEEQIKQLGESAFPIAVGTPHRILTLAQQGALSLEKTQLIALDTEVNDKKFSVYTLPDTVPHTQSFLKDFVLAECKKRRDIHVSFI